MGTRVLRTILAALAFLTTTILAADLSPGLVKDQPASGRFVKTDQGYMVPYEQSIPGTDAKFHMQPIPGGKVLVGSPDGEPGHKPDESPQIEVTIDPFWMSTYEVTWTEYKQYMAMQPNSADAGRLKEHLARLSGRP